MPYFLIPPEAERHPRIVGYSPVIARLNAEIDRVAEHDHEEPLHPAYADEKAGFVVARMFVNANKTVRYFEHRS